MLDYTQKPFYLTAKDLEWVTDTVKKMTTEEKLDQVFVDMIWKDSEKDITKSVKEYPIRKSLGLMDSSSPYKRYTFIFSEGK